MSPPGPSVLPRIAGPADFASAFAVSRETVARLETYAETLQRWQPAVNLVAPATLQDLWHRHIADSAQLDRLVPAARCWIDLGSGAGFPGLVIAILRGGRDGFAMTLVESDVRKAAFLREVARRCAIPVDIHAVRAEAFATQAKNAHYDVVSARALAPLERLLGLASPFLAGEATGLFPKGREAAAEVEAACKAWSFEAELVESRTDAEARIVVVRHLEQRTGGHRS